MIVSANPARSRLLGHGAAVQAHDPGVGDQRRPPPDTEGAQALAHAGERAGLDDD